MIVKYQIMIVKYQIMIHLDLIISDHDCRISNHDPWISNILNIAKRFDIKYFEINAPQTDWKHIKCFQSIFRVFNAPQTHFIHVKRIQCGLFGVNWSDITYA